MQEFAGLRNRIDFKKHVKVTGDNYFPTFIIFYVPFRNFPTIQAG